MDARFRTVLNFALVSLMAAGMVSCKSKSTDTGASTIAEPYGDTTVGTVVDAVGFNISLTKDYIGLYDIHKTTSWTLPCTATAGQDIACYVDGMELDFYVRGLELRYNVPKEMCKYYVFSPYFYYNMEPGIGAEGFAYDVNAAGAVVSQSITGAHAANSYWDGTTPKCDYDYSGANGPNCCLGSYTLTTRTWDPSLNVDPVSGVAAGGWGAPAVRTVEWGGAYGNCLKGPAMDTQQKTRDGWPKSTISNINVETEGANVSYKIAPPIEMEKGRNVYIANFSAAVLAAPDTAASWGNVFYSSAGIYRTARPYYELTCYDRAEEIKSRIRLYVREWNSVAEFDLRTTTGSPDAGGNEATYPNQPVNDYTDWADLSDGDTFPFEL